MVDVSQIEASVTIERMEKQLFDARPGDLERLNKDFQERYGELWEVYVSVMLRSGSPKDSMIVVSLDRFISDPTMIQVYQDISATYPELDWLKEDLEQAFRYLRYYYPDAAIPRIVTYNSVFNYGVSTFKDQIGLGLDMYLGPENRTVKKISPEALPQFLKEKMIKEYMVVDIMRGWIEANYLDAFKGQDFLSRMIHEGKILYAMDALLPADPDHIKIRYTPEQLGWCLQNEKNIWRDIVDKKLLYTTDQMEIRKFCDESPFTSGLPQNSPGRVGNWLGWMIVRAYMKDHPELKLPDLLDEKNERKILKSYKPPKE